MSRRRHRTMSFSYPSQIERQIDSFLETFKRRSAAAMERAQSLQGGPGGLLSPHCFYDPGPPEGTPPPKMRSPRCSPRVKFHIPGRRSRWVWNGRSVSAGVPRSKSGVSVASSGTDSGSDSMEGVTRSLPHSLHTWASADSIPGEAAGDAGAIQAFPFLSLSLAGLIAGLPLALARYGTCLARPQGRGRRRDTRQNEAISPTCCSPTRGGGVLWGSDRR